MIRVLWFGLRSGYMDSIIVMKRLLLFGTIKMGRHKCSKIHQSRNWSVFVRARYDVSLLCYDYHQNIMETNYYLSDFPVLLLSNYTLVAIEGTARLAAFSWPHFPYT